MSTPQYDALAQRILELSRMPAPPPMRLACGFDEAKRLILAGRANEVLVNTRVLAELKADPELIALAEAQREGRAP